MHPYLIVSNCFYLFHVRRYPQNVKLIVHHNTCFAFAYGQQEPLIEPRSCLSMRLRSKPFMDILLAKDVPTQRYNSARMGLVV